MLISSSVLSCSFSLSCLWRKFGIVPKWMAIVFLCIPVVFLQFPVLLLVCFTWSYLELVYVSDTVTARASSRTPNSPLLGWLCFFHRGLCPSSDVPSASLPSPACPSPPFGHFLWCPLLLCFLPCFFLISHTDLSQVLPLARVLVFSGIHRGHSAFNLSHQSIFL